MNRRQYLQTTLTGALSLIVPKMAFPAMQLLDAKIRFGLIADLHQDLIHDGLDRMQAFAKAMKKERPDATIQMGDFAHPSTKNQAVISLFNQTSCMPLHVIGNHDTDGGHTKQQCLDVWGMPARYYQQQVKGVLLLVLDGNEPGSPGHRGGYASYIGPEQRAWLRESLTTATGPVIVVSHQPLAGPIAVDDAPEVQAILSEFASKILLALNGHSHIDYLLRINQVSYLHVNSAAYFWVGDRFKHATYPPGISSKYPVASLSCPYRESLFATLTIDPANNTIAIQGRATEWVGPSPTQLGLDAYPYLHTGEEIAPHIRPRVIERVGG
ncbi:MAG: metallophosphoesterase [Haliscomenobacter sp.]|nr:metallophosphoesterase [Haliscomenobacter sp.]